jgi:hypothetical protein
MTAFKGGLAARFLTASCNTAKAAGQVLQYEVVNK